MFGDIIGIRPYVLTDSRNLYDILDKCEMLSPFNGELVPSFLIEDFDKCREKLSEEEFEELQRFKEKITRQYLILIST